MDSATFARRCLASLGALAALSLFGCSGAPTEEDLATSSDSEAIRVCAPGPTVKGVDVSYYEETVDWHAVKGSGRAFGFARVSDGLHVVDPKFSANWSGMASAGVVRGAYQFFRPAQDPTQQADLFVSKVGTLGAHDLPAVLDIEVEDGVSASTIRAHMKIWLDRVAAKTGKTPMIYTAAFMSGAIGTGFTGYPLWVANYGASCPSMPTGFTKWRFWQTSESGSVSGIPVKTDLDVWNGTMSELLAFANGS